MASYHHTHNPHHPTCCCRCSCCASSHPSLLSPSPSPSPSLSDSLLQIIASHLLQSPPPNFQSKYQHQHHQQTQTQTQSQTQTLLLLQSLLSRVSALESSLHHLSSPPSPSPPPPPPPSQTTPPPTPFPSLRNLAARTIQTHFRAFLVRRSQTLRNLKDLATIRSNFASLKSSLLDKAHHTPDVVSQKASDLLIKLDSVQSRDSLINEGKRAIRAELSQFLETVEGLSAKCHSNLPPKLKKRVTFAENAITPGADSARNISGGESEGVRVFLSVGENEEDGCHPEMEGFHNQMSDVRNPRRMSFMDGGSHEANGIFNGLKGKFQGQIGNFGFDHSCELPNMGMGNEFGYGMNGWGYAQWPMNGDLGKLGFTAPMPVQMEKRANDYLKERLFDNPGKW